MTSTVLTTTPTSNINSENSGTRGFSIGIMIFIFVVAIIYVIVLFELYKQKRFIFAPYVPPTPPAPFFYPLGKITPLTQEEIDHRNAVIAASK